jgi:phage terminase large subunit
MADRWKFSGGRPFKTMQLTGKVFKDVYHSNSRIVALQGGSRSGKTYAVLQWLVRVCQLNADKRLVITVCRATLPALKASAMRDFFEILLKEQVYEEQWHNKTENTYQLFGNLVEFISLDQPQKVRGRKRNILFINEANEITFDAWVQLLIRTTDKVILDYNPSDEYHWIYDKVLSREDCEFYQSSYKDNPFLEQSLVDEIEELQDVDENLWRVFGLGERGTSKANIYTHWQVCESLPALDRYCYGLDFGYGHPTALVQCRYYNNANYWHEVIYGSGITTNDLIAKMKELMIDRRVEIFADSARSDTIEEIYRAGFNIKKADKTVTDGILFIKSKPLYITRESTNLLKEIRSYKWMEDKNGRILDAPVKLFDDGMDAGRYGSYTFNKPAFKIKTHNT